MRGLWDHYFQINDEILAQYRKATKRSMARAWVILNNDLDTAWSDLLASTEKIAKSLDARHRTHAAAFDATMASLRGIVSTLADSARTMSGTAADIERTTGRISGSAAEASLRATEVSSAAGLVSENVQTVAAASEEMGASIHEIARSAQHAVRVADEAVREAETTRHTIDQLGRSSQEIGNVVKLISSIAEQTNLLALNATIEAARAGEAGKGFAVVAGEVKDLAGETARATEDISARVGAIQADAAGAVTAIDRIGAVVSRISDSQNTIAAAVRSRR